MHASPLRCLAPVLLLLMVPAARAADPTDNPVATFYSGAEGYPAWTDNIRWERVINMKTYPKGKTEYEKFLKARDELSEGGGVLYYPGGVYDFSTMPPGVGLNLVPGVVIRGEAPAGRPVAAAGKLELATKFVFAFRTRGGGKVPADWNFIGLQPDGKKNIKTRERLGIAWVHLDGATVAFGPQMDWGKTWGTANSLLSDKLKGSWAGRDGSGTHPIDALAGGGQKYMGAGSCRLVFGCVFENAAVLDDYSNPGYGALEGFEMTESQVVNEWITKGLEQGRLTDRREILLGLLNKRFPGAVSAEIAKFINEQESPDLLKGWINAVLDVDTFEGFMAVLKQ